MKYLRIGYFVLITFLLTGLPVQTHATDLNWQLWMNYRYWQHHHHLNQHIPVNQVQNPLNANPVPPTSTTQTIAPVQSAQQRRLARIVGHNRKSNDPRSKL